MMKNPASLWQRLLPLFLFAFLLNPSSATLASSTFVAPSQNDGYISDISGDGLYRWSKDRFPLKVYMEPGTGLPGYKDAYPEVLKACFDDWSKASDGKLSWKSVDNPKKADIVVAWSDQAVEAQRGTEAGKTKTFARYNTQTNWGRIDRAEMRLLTRLPERDFSDAEVRKAYLHEVGHAFGIAGHSSNRDDIMYFAVSRQQPGVLSNRDVATMNYLYQGDTAIIGSERKNSDHLIGSAPAQQPANRL